MSLLRIKNCLLKCIFPKPIQPSFNSKKNIFNISNVLNLDNSSYPPWRTGEIIEKCLYELKSTNGPVVYESGEIRKYDTSMRQEIRREIPCEIIIADCNIADIKKITHGCGCYYGYGHVLTALHVFEGLEKFEILVAFPNEKQTLIYKAEFTKSCNTDTDRDQAFIKLLGDTSPLGDGLENQIAKASENESVYFYTLEPDGNFQKQEGKILHPNSNMTEQMITDEFITSVAGIPGDSGSPVYNTKHELIGIYRGIFTCCCSRIFPQLPWVQTLIAIYRRIFTSHNELAYGRYSGISPQFIPWVQTSVVLQISSNIL